MLGLAVLLARLSGQLMVVEQYVVGTKEPVAEYLQQWMEQLKRKNKNQVQSKNVPELIQQKTAAQFLRVLEDTEGFKRDAQGIAALIKLLHC